MLAPEEFGTAVAISVVLGLAELVTDVALDRFVMVNSSPNALSAAHVLVVVRGVLIALGLVALAPAAAKLFGVPQFTGSFALAAIVPLVQGFNHLSVKRMRLDFGYGPESISQLASNLAAIVSLWVAVIVLHDHRAIVFSFATESFVYMILSHILAGAPYRLGTTKSTLHEALSFGLPLTFNGIGLAVISQLDRVLAGYWFGVETLATYAVILSMSVAPASAILAMFSPLGLSYFLSDENASSTVFEKYRLLAFFFSTLSLLYVFFVVLTLDVLIPIIFGRAFSINPTVHVIIAAIVCLRLQRNGAPTTLLLAAGRTGQLALLNLSTGFGLIIAVAMLFTRPTLESMLLGILIGDVVAFVLFFGVAYRRTAPRRSEIVIDLAIAFVAPMLIVAALAWNPAHTWKARSLLFGIGLFAVCMQIAAQTYIYGRWPSSSLQPHVEGRRSASRLP